MAFSLLAIRAACICMVATITFSAIGGAESPKGDSPMTVSDGKIISMEYTLTLENKEVIDTNVGGKPLKFTQGSHEIIVGLETALEGMKTGDSKKVTVAPEKGYGPHNPQAVREVPIDKIPPEAREVGAQLQGKDGEGRVVHPRVAEVNEQVVVLDFNHPLAGKTLYFDVKILDIEAPTTP